MTGDHEQPERPASELSPEELEKRFREATKELFAATYVATENIQETLRVIFKLNGTLVKYRLGLVPERVRVNDAEVRKNFDEALAAAEEQIGINLKGALGFVTTNGEDMDPHDLETLRALYEYVQSDVMPQEKTPETKKLRTAVEKFLLDAGAKIMVEEGNQAMEEETA